MPKTNVAYGNSYKPCPCAQIHEYTTTGNTYYTATCYSPKRERGFDIPENEQIRICMGGTSHGKRYTSCPYYVKNAKINAPRRTRSNSPRNIASHILSCILFWMVASSCINSGAQYAGLFSFLFFVAGIACIVSLFTKDDKIDNNKRGRKSR